MVQVPTLPAICTSRGTAKVDWIFSLRAAVWPESQRATEGDMDWRKSSRGPCGGLLSQDEGATPRND